MKYALASSEFHKRNNETSWAMLKELVRNSVNMVHIELYIKKCMFSNRHSEASEYLFSIDLQKLPLVEQLEVQGLPCLAFEAGGENDKFDAADFF